MLFKFFGIWLITDGFLSMLLVIDKHWKWQLARFIRMGIGVCLIFY